MIGQLTSEQIDEVLRSESIGRIGCHANDQTYVVPVTYAYDGAAVYGHTDLGLKVRLMRANPNVCFEVEHLEDMANWRTVIAWGVYEELSGEEGEKGWILLMRRLSALLRSETAHPPAAGGYANYRVHTAGGHGHIYRIVLTKKTGRFEARGQDEPW